MQAFLGISSDLYQLMSIHKSLASGVVTVDVRGHLGQETRQRGGKQRTKQREFTFVICYMEFRFSYSRPPRGMTALTQLPLIWLWRRYFPEVEFLEHCVILSGPGQDLPC